MSLKLTKKKSRESELSHHFRLSQLSQMKSSPLKYLECYTLLVLCKVTSKANSNNHALYGPLRKEPHLIRIHYPHVPVAQAITMTSKYESVIKILKFFSFIERD
jgi:hypothetical protein